jgi:hypothetical protein
LRNQLLPFSTAIIILNFKPVGFGYGSGVAVVSTQIRTRSAPREMDRGVNLAGMD